MYLNFQSVIVDIFIIACFVVHVYLAFGSIKSMSAALSALLNKGVTDVIFKKVKRLIFGLSFLCLCLSCLVTWRSYELLLFLNVNGYGLYIFLSTFLLYSFAILAAFTFCKLLLMTAQRSGL